MGAYVNPEGIRKEEWLNLHGEPKGLSVGDQVAVPTYDSYEEGTLPVVLVDNGPFTAAAIAFSKWEYKEFTKITDKRPKIFFAVKTDLLYPVSNLEEYLPKK